MIVQLISPINFLQAKKLIDKKLIGVASYNSAFCASVAEESPIIFGSILGFGSARKSLLGFWFLFFTFVFQSAAVPGGRNSNSTPAQSAIVVRHPNEHPANIHHSDKCKECNHQRFISSVVSVIFRNSTLCYKKKCYL